MKFVATILLCITLFSCAPIERVAAPVVINHIYWEPRYDYDTLRLTKVVVRNYMQIQDSADIKMFRAVYDTVWTLNHSNEKYKIIFR